MTIQESFGARVRELRKGKGISQERLADLVGLDRSYMGQVERGEVCPSLDTIARIAGGLGISVSKLLSGLAGIVGT